MWIIVILVVLGICAWGIVNDLKKQAAKQPDRLFAEKYGYAPDELVKIIRTSPNVDKIVGIIVQSSYPQKVYIHTDHIDMYDGENPYGEKRYFKEFNCSDLPPNAKYCLVLARALKDKLPAFYELRDDDYTYWLEIKNDEKKKDCTIKGW